MNSIILTEIKDNKINIIKNRIDKLNNQLINISNIDINILNKNIEDKQNKQIKENNDKNNDRIKEYKELLKNVREELNNNLNIYSEEIIKDKKKLINKYKTQIYRINNRDKVNKRINELYHSKKKLDENYMNKNKANSLKNRLKKEIEQTELLFDDIHNKLISM